MNSLSKTVSKFDQKFHHELFPPMSTHPFPLVCFVIIPPMSSYPNGLPRWTRRLGSLRIVRGLWRTRWSWNSYSPLAHLILSFNRIKLKYCFPFYFPNIKMSLNNFRKFLFSTISLPILSIFGTYWICKAKEINSKISYYIFLPLKII